MARVELRQVRKSFGAADVILGVDLDIADGEFIVLVGPSGCGKSTLLRAIAGLEAISSGHLLINDQDMTYADPVRRGIAMVFQSYALYPHMTVAENIGFGLKIGGAAKAEISARVREVAQLLQLEPLLNRKPKALSGGQRQRVAIGRALARKPPIFLFDEPLSNLDAALRAEMRVELARLHGALGNTMIYVTHDQVEAMTLADRIVVMRAGVIEQVGTPLELFNDPVNRFVAGFLGQPPMNFIRAVSARHEKGRLMLELPGPTEFVVEDRTGIALDLVGLELGIRPEDIEIVDDSSGLSVTVDVVEQLGGETIAYSRLVDNQPFVLRLPGQAILRAGTVVRVVPHLGRALAFTKDGRSIHHPLATLSEGAAQ